MHEYIVEELSGEFVAVFINLLLSTEPAILSKTYVQFHLSFPSELKVNMGGIFNLVM